MKDFNDLGPWIKRMAAEAGLPIYKLANRAGVSRATLYAWISDVYRPDSEVLLRVCQVLSQHTTHKSEDLFAEASALYTPRPEGNPHSSSWAEMSAKSRGRSKKE